MSELLIHWPSFGWGFGSCVSIVGIFLVGISAASH